MPWWSKRKRRRFTPFDRAALPEAEPLTFDETYNEGLLVAEAAGRMALKNRIIVRALRGDEPFDRDRASAEAREVLRELIHELDQVAEWAETERETAAKREGRSAHQHDYHRADSWNLRLRERINEAVAARLGELRNDSEYLARFAERARQDAWAELSDAIEQRLAREWPDIEVDETYLAEREDRMADVASDLLRDLDGVRQRREERDALDDAFGGW
ncbi:hypothetical protein [Agromyces salentinus]|uniref:Asparagine synthase n=1 Tax=Agromyces salentinus TaxID=269421 RepID=A0ABN2MH24_9MICO|nr:hypothetical protein [Agromyces salentinus]